MLIVSPEAFNRVTKVPVVLPITGGGNFARTAGFAVALDGAGTKTTGMIRCDQPRALVHWNFKPVIDRVFPLAEAAAAQRRLEEKGQFGKIVLVP